MLSNQIIHGITNFYDLLLLYKSFVLIAINTTMFVLFYCLSVVY